MTTIQSYAFGTAANGEPVRGFRLSNEKIEADIITLGAAVQSVRVPDRTGAMTDVCLGFSDVQGYETQTCFIGAVVGRYANRIGGASFSLNGKTYPLFKNDGEHHLHGGPTGFHTKNWDAQVCGETLVLSCKSADMEEGYPGNMTVWVTYALTEAGGLSITYEAQCDKDTVCNLTNHAYFNLSGDRCDTICTHEIKINADRFTRVDGGAIPTGELPEVSGTPFDFRDFHAIGARIDEENSDLQSVGGYDHNFVIRGEGFREAACVRCEETGIEMRVFTDLPGMQFYAGNFLDGSFVGKTGKPYEKRSGFCLETQYFPDSPNRPEFPCCVLKAGARFASKTVYEFEQF